MPKGRPRKVSTDKPISPPITTMQDNCTTDISTEYTVKGKPKTISALCRQSVSQYGNYYTIEYKEERELPLDEDINLNKEKEALWYSVNSEVDKQLNDLMEWVERQRNNCN